MTTPLGAEIDRLREENADLRSQLYMLEDEARRDGPDGFDPIQCIAALRGRKEAAVIAAKFAEQRLKQIEAALRYLLDVLEDSCHSGYIPGSRSDMDWDKRMTMAREDATDALAAAQKGET